LREETERKLTAWVPAVVYTALIFAVSSIPGSIHQRIPFRYFDKVAHIGEFAALALFLVVAFRGTLPEARQRAALPIVVIVGLLIGLLDELWQYNIPGRAVEFLDWVSDMIGIVGGTWIADSHYRRRHRARPAAGGGPTH
jgi:hypothetical protein